MEKEEKLKQICNQFTFKGVFKLAEPYGDGHINDTFKVTYMVDDVGSWSENRRYSSSRYS